MPQASRRMLAACWGTPVLRVGSRARFGARPPPRTRSGSGVNARVCPSGLGASTAYAAGCRICRARVPPLAITRRQ
eukprot:15439650-Alexandrium_andersonii.AAC.1